MPGDRAMKLPVGKGKLEIKVSNVYPTPAARVWEAVTQARHVERFFVDKVEGDFTPELAPVVWQWTEWGRHTLRPTAMREGTQVEFCWASHKGTYLTTVTFALRRKGKATELEIRECGWAAADLGNAFDNCNGWTMYLDYLKAYLLYGIDLRTRTRGAKEISMDEKTMQHGAFSWNELVTTDLEAAKKFYTALFGWQTAVAPMEGMTYILIKVGGEDVGGMMAILPDCPEMQGMQPHWGAYVTVRDVDATAAQAEKMGGKLLCPPMDIPQVGRFCVIQDSQGAVLAAITYTRK